MNFSPTFSLRCSSRFMVLSELPSPPSSPFLFFNIEIPTVKTPPASPTKRTRTSAVKGKSGAAVPAAQDDDEADDDDSATPPASPTKRARRGPAKGKGKDRSA
ncbi:hypothetical protein H9P43_003056 [Blastocladiella emersonii ATCC 22665]|nr:hypothetical protein H9P43_003056 [Blastocladiella emersonii ATCC 22665]